MKTTVKSGSLEITVTDAGAELLSVKYQGKERLWQNPDGSWAGHAPVLFPVCGACEMRVGGKRYPCPRHGFATERGFTLTEKRENGVTYRLTSDARSKELYPYDFVLEVEYGVEGNRMDVTYTVSNPQGEKMYFSCGGHDSFALDKALGFYELEFEKAEEFYSKLVDEKGYLTGQSRHLGTGLSLGLDVDLLENGNSVCLDGLFSRSVVLREKATKKKVAKVGFPDSQKLVLWRPAGAKMLCIEPWQNLPDGKGESGEFSRKDGVIGVAPFGKKTIGRRVTYY